jgi:hypothetical protein
MWAARAAALTVMVCGFWVFPGGMWQMVVFSPPWTRAPASKKQTGSKKSGSLEL